MQDEKKKPELESDNKTSKDDENGFLVLQMKVGHTLQVGEATIVVNDIIRNTVKVAIKAKRHILIRKTP